MDMVHYTFGNTLQKSVQGGFFYLIENGQHLHLIFINEYIHLVMKAAGPGSRVLAKQICCQR